MVDMLSRISVPERRLLPADGHYTLWLKGAESMSAQRTSAHDDRQVLARFWAKVRKGEPNECWLWTASKRNKGYGAFSYTLNGRMVQDRAHRFSYVLHVGP